MGKKNTKIERPSKECLPIPDSEMKEYLEELGVVFGDKIDEMMISCVVPSEWKFVIADETKGLHSSKLINEKDEVIAKIEWSSNDIYGRKAHILKEKKLTRVNSKYKSVR